MLNKEFIFYLLSLFYFPLRSYFLLKIINIKRSNIMFGKNIKLQKISQLILDDHILINSNMEVVGKGNVKISSYTYTAPNVTYITTTHNKSNMEMITLDIEVEKLCWIGANVLILPGVKIGEGSLIGSGCVVSKDIPPYSIVIGNPCKIISKREIQFPYRLPGGKYYIDVNNKVVKK